VMFAWVSAIISWRIGSTGIVSPLKRVKLALEFDKQQFIT